MSALRPNQRERAPSRAGAAGPPTSQPNGILNGIIDPTKTGQYPVILSDTLLGGTQTDVFTAVQYNHKPQPLSSDAATTPSTLKPATPGNESNFQLSLEDSDGGKYSYSGTRTTDKSQYVLYFDAAKKAFILDRIDSTFHMNLTRTPNNTDPEALREQFQHLDTSPTPSPPEPVQGARKATAAGTKPTAKAAAKPSVKQSSLKNSNAAATNAITRKQGPSTPAGQTKPDKKKEAKVVQLALPQNNRPPEPKTTTAPAETTTTATTATTTKRDKDKDKDKDTDKDKRSRRQEQEEDEDDDEDDEDIGLTIEYPDEPPRSRGGGGADFSPAFPAQRLTVRRFSEFLRDSEADDADGESEPEEDGFKLPSPVNNRHAPYHHAGDDNEEDDEDEEDEFEDVHVAPAGGQQQHQRHQAEQMDVDAGVEDELDLEAELEDALEQAANSGDAGEESEVSEED
ncbi:hypothetical protein SODALDRAFT_321414 [Sodiomyces alkalinus F11]|uniref:Transcription elongation factor Eaf N-terminal domain-containing protein n=1 Tax=Sodiomyces alkalinus (strain CBS 110278 / VKM F-3762 / F11) TaxID=1314773 RepID=A0A3N2PJQ2_SODAK|nr:hypothetical protein SODALDRAFT_321414 [Sodiomyces alkalinus F11]ROT34757.1 hypothetical protein SODALDRAFT_321414 [Sodiomyces alkalinus F11]